MLPLQSPTVMSLERVRTYLLTNFDMADLPLTALPQVRRWLCPVLNSIFPRGLRPSCGLRPLYLLLRRGASVPDNQISKVHALQPFELDHGAKPAPRAKPNS